MSRSDSDRVNSKRSEHFSNNIPELSSIDTSVKLSGMAHEVNIFDRMTSSRFFDLFNFDSSSSWSFDFEVLGVGMGIGSGANERSNIAAGRKGYVPADNISAAVTESMGRIRFAFNGVIN